MELFSYGKLLLYLFVFFIECYVVCNKCIRRNQMKRLYRPCLSALTTVEDIVLFGYIKDGLVWFQFDRFRHLAQYPVA